MPRSTTSDLHPVSPFYGLAGRQNGRFSAGTAVVTIAQTGGIKPNMCCAPTTNGSRAEGLAASKPNSARSMKKMGPRLSS